MFTLSKTFTQLLHEKADTMLSEKISTLSINKEGTRITLNLVTDEGMKDAVESDVIYSFEKNKTQFYLLR